MEVRDIHPFDVSAMLQSPECCEIVMNKDGTMEIPAHSGRYYRQTVSAPISTEHGKKLQQDFASKEG